MAYAQQHIGDIGDNTHATENALPFANRLRCGQTERGGTFLYRLVVEKYHSDGTVSESAAAEYNEQYTEEQPLKHQFCNHPLFLLYPSASVYSGWDSK